MQINIIKAKMLEKGLTQKELAKELEISERTLTNRFQTGIFKSNEIEKMIILFDIKNPSIIFFGSKLT